MNENPNQQNISMSMPVGNNDQAVLLIKSRNIKNWRIVLIAILVLIISGYFVWQNYKKPKMDPAIVPVVENYEKVEKNIAASSIKSLIETRDMERKIDLINLLLALQNYKKDKNSYPSTNGVTEKTEDKNSIIYSLILNYIKKIPIDHQSPDFYYGYNSDGKSFTITARLENGKDPDCFTTGKICLYKLTENNTEEELLKIVRENLDLIKSVRVVSAGDWVTLKPNEDVSRLFDSRNTISEALLDLANEKSYTFSYQGDNKDKKIGELIIIGGKSYLKSKSMAGVDTWNEVKKKNTLSGAADSQNKEIPYSISDFFSNFDFIKSVSDVQKVTVETIANKEYYRLSLRPKHKERNKFLDEYLNSKIEIFAPGKKVDDVLSNDAEKEFIFEKEKVFKFIENNKQIVIPFSVLITRPIFRVLLSSSAYNENVYTVYVFSITGDIWIDKETFMPYRENTSKYEVMYDYNLQTKEKDFWDEANEFTTNIQYFDINKEFDIRAPELARIDDSPENKNFTVICDKIKGISSKNQCIGLVNDKQSVIALLKTKTVEACEKIAHATGSVNTERDDCFLNLMKETKNTSICEKIEDFWETRTDCYTEAAKITGNADFCQKIDFDNTEKWCVGDGAKTVICQYWGMEKDIFKREGIDNFKNYCIALAKKDINICKGSRTYGAGEDECYRDIAVQTKDYSLCDKINSGTMQLIPWEDGATKSISVEKNQCYAQVAVAANNVSLCDKIDITGDNVNDSQKYTCINNVAVSNLNETLCDKLPDDNKKDTCFLGVVRGLIQK